MYSWCAFSIRLVVDITFGLMLDFYTPDVYIIFFYKTFDLIHSSSFIYIIKNGNCLGIYF